MSSFPLVKLFSLFVKQLSKPVAGYIKQKSKDNYWVRKYICIPPAQCMYVPIIIIIILKKILLLLLLLL